MNENNVVVNPDDFDPERFLGHVKRDKPVATMIQLDRPNADVNYRYENGWTALMHGSNEGGRRVVPVLLEYNADPNLTNNEGKTALIIAAESDEQYIEIIEALLEHGADIDIQDNNGNTAEMVATEEVADMIAEYREYRDYVPEEEPPPPSDDVPMDYGAARRRKTRRKGKKVTKKSKKTRKGKGRR
jgi:ankyrin repeat protein